MRSVWEFLAIAIVVTLTPGPATATVLRIAGRDGRRAALSAVAGNSAGVLMWGALAAVGISPLILASEIAYDALRIGGAAILVYLGARSLLRRGDDADEAVRPRRARGGGWRSGLVTSVSNPKLATFFVALFPQFLGPHSHVLPLALAMAGTIVALDVIWFSALTLAVDRAGAVLRPRLRRRLERFSGAVMVAFGARLVAEAR